MNIDIHTIQWLLEAAFSQYWILKYIDVKIGERFKWVLSAQLLSLGPCLGVAVRREQGGGRGRERRGGGAAPPRHPEARGQGGDCGHALNVDIR